MLYLEPLGEYMSQPKVSIIIPYCPGEKQERLLNVCLDSLPETFERIIVVNDYTGFTKNVNLGLRAARGDYLAIVNSDMEWLNGYWSDLCIPRVVTSPKVNNQAQYFWGCFFVIPHEVYQKVGPLDERFFLYCSDTDYVCRLREAQMEMRCIESCETRTFGGQTTSEMPLRRQYDDEDTAAFIQKWGRKPSL